MKNWNELTTKGKSARLNKALSLVDSDCVTTEIVDNLNNYQDNNSLEGLEKAREILISNSKKGGKLGYHYSQQDNVISLLE